MKGTLKKKEENSYYYFSEHFPFFFFCEKFIYTNNFPRHFLVELQKYYIQKNNVYKMLYVCLCVCVYRNCAAFFTHIRKCLCV